ncbi:MAG: hypothetical protein LC798_12685 [Chloroflexi bacterium]|nr:hypothetical protein [Chloroflexota bacterium]
MTETAKADKAAGEPRPTQSSTPDTPEERRFTVEELQGRARTSLGVSPIVVAGVLSQSNRKTFTLEQAEAEINAALKRPAESDAPEGQYPEPEDDS